MNSYYQILGVEENADEGAIKRAYFKQVRKYPPDQAPEQFKQAREAYEVLMDQERRQFYDRTKGLDATLLDSYRNVIMCVDMGDYETAVQDCEAVLQRSEEEVFECLLGEIYLLNGSSGKAVKQFEKLCEKYPEKTEYKKWLVNAYRERSWNKKAQAVLKDMEPECAGDVDFLLLQGNVLCGLKLYGPAGEKFDAARKVFQEEEVQDSHFSERLWPLLVKQFQRIPGAVVENMTSTYAAYANAYGRKRQRLEPSFPAIINELAQCEESVEIDITELNNILEMTDEWKKSGKLTGRDLLVELMAERKLEQIKLYRDGRIRELIRSGADLMYSYDMMKETVKIADRSQEKKFLEISIKEEAEPLIAEMRLHIIQELPGIRKEMVIIKEEYPKLAEAYGDFIDEIIRNNSRAFLLNKYEKKIKRSFAGKMAGLLDLWAGSCGADLNEEDFDAEGVDYGWDETAQPYRRETRKIGRNEPCPCGSGKKYKNCCGKL